MTAAAFDLTGGAGIDVLVAGADMTAGSFSGFKILELSATSAAVAFKASQLSGSDMTVVGGTGDVLSITGSDLAAIDLSTLNFEANSAVATAVNVSTIDTARFLSTQAFNITGSDVADAMSFGVAAATYEAITDNGTIAAATTVGGAVAAAYALAAAGNDGGIEAISFTYGGATYVAVEDTNSGNAGGAHVAILDAFTGTLALANVI